MPVLTISKDKARAIIVHAAGLAKKAQFGKGIEAAYKVIDHLGFIQVDTNFVVERAHHHAIYSRVPDYRVEWLRDLQADGRIFEFWTRDSGFMPVTEYRFSIPLHQVFAARWTSIPQAERNLMDRILDRIGREGPLSAKDFDNDRVEKSSGWWDWRPSKVALERLHMTGQLLTIRKPDFHKLYDLPKNILPVDVDATAPSAEEFTRHLIMRSLQSLGLAQPKEIAWNARFVKPNVKAELKKLAEEGVITEVAVEGVKAPLYMLSSYKKKKITLAGDAFVLSPFDMINIYRHRLRDFFDFDYQVECFVPAAKRKYGYFSLPILIGDKFVARMDAKAERKEQTLIVHNLHFEDIKLDDGMLLNIGNAIKDFATFNGCKTVTIVKCNKRMLLSALRRLL